MLRQYEIVQDLLDQSHACILGMNDAVRLENEVEFHRRRKEFYENAHSALLQLQLQSESDHGAQIHDFLRKNGALIAYFEDRWRSDVLGEQSSDGHAVQPPQQAKTLRGSPAPAGRRRSLKLDPLDFDYVDRPGAGDDRSVITACLTYHQTLEKLLVLMVTEERTRQNSERQ